MLAVLSVYKFIISKDEHTLLDCANFANDTIVLFKAVNSVLKSKTYKTQIDAIKVVLEKLKGKNLFLNILLNTKYDVISSVVVSSLEFADYIDKRDYNAANLTASAAVITLSVYMFNKFIKHIAVRSIATPVAIASVIIAFGRALIEDSELTNFLKRTIFAKTGISTEFTPKSRIIYKPYFLNEAFKKSDKNIYLELATPKELIEFIGNNYKKNKDIFNLAFRNELQFLYTTLVDLKLEIDSKRVKEEAVEKQTFLKIPKILIDDEKAEFLLNGESYDVKDRKLFIDKIEYYHFDLYDYFNKTTNTIILKSSMVDFKYEFNYHYSFTSLTDIYIEEKANEYYGIKKFKQVNFE